MSCRLKNKCRTATDEDVFVLYTTVKHSQSVNNTDQRVWVPLKKCGIISSHRSCMAGLGEACAHVVAVMFKTWLIHDRLEEKMLSQVSCTPKKCTWIIRNSLSNVESKRLFEIIFASAKDSASKKPQAPVKIPRTSLVEQGDFFKQLLSAKELRHLCQ